MTSYLVWCDIEATDKDPLQGKMLEIALIITTKNLQVLARLHQVVHFDQSQLDTLLAPWSRDTHTKSGLLSECTHSTTSLHAVEQKCFEFLSQYAQPCHVGENLILAGSAIAFDMSCLRREMPKVASLFHYRTLDVNSWMLPISWWCQPWHLSRPEQTLSRRHRAEADIEDSLRLMQHYQSLVSFSTLPTTRSYASCLKQDYHD